MTFHLIKNKFYKQTAHNNKNVKYHMDTELKEYAEQGALNER